jgi:hypothetical protein
MPGGRVAVCSELLHWSAVRTGRRALWLVQPPNQEGVPRIRLVERSAFVGLGNVGGVR